MGDKRWAERGMEKILGLFSVSVIQSRLHFLRNGLKVGQSFSSFFYV